MLWAESESGRGALKCDYTEHTYIHTLDPMLWAESESGRGGWNDA